MKNTDRSVIARSFRAAFPHTIPILAGFLFLGMAYGIYMNVQGFSFVYPMLMALVIFGGSLEFLAVEMLLSPFAPLQVLLVSLMIQARHLFYGISMLDKFKDMGWKKFYLIYGMCDETFSVNYTAGIPEDCDRGWFYFFVTALNPALLGRRSHPGRASGQPDTLQHQRAGFRHDGDVHRDIPGAVAQGEAPLQRLGRNALECRVPADLRRGQLSYPDDDMHTGAADRVPQTHRAQGGAP